jgi:peptidoglycan hydrolase-like protein with peptidoglycan-binding domain
MNLDAIPFIQARNFTWGRKVQPSLIVIHDMEAGEYSTTAESCASYFAGGNAPQASAHYCCDNNSTVCSVKPDDTAWHTGENSTNNCGIGIEQAGYANQGIGFGTGWADQYSQDMIINQVAPLCAALCERYGIPVHFLTADDLRAGDRVGITSHREITYAFVKGGHTDPGPDYPWDQLLSEISKNLGGQAPAPQPPQTPNPSTDVFGLGSTGNKVKTIQALVGASQDGVYGPKTQAAVTVWQRNLNIPADGIWGPRTDEATTQFFVWLSSQNHHPASGEGDAFVAAVASAASQILKEGAVGGSVKILQGALNLKGYALVQDGVFGPATDSAVRRYQRDHNLRVDGIVGPNTWNSILS